MARDVAAFSMSDRGERVAAWLHRGPWHSRGEWPTINDLVRAFWQHAIVITNDEFGEGQCPPYSIGR